MTSNGSASWIKRIDVTYQAEEQERTLLIALHRPIVNNGIKYTSRGERLREYKVVESADNVTLVARKRRKRVAIDGDKNYSRAKPVRHRGVVRRGSGFEDSFKRNWSLHT
jgi:hypothetical protein